MQPSNPPSSEASNWQVVGALLVFVALYLVWAIGFDLVAGWLSGGKLEAVLNWLTNAGFWLTWAVIGGAIAVGVGRWVLGKVR